jgi:anti-sigma regulatory factor (Ser/Thr protein kinase)
VFPGHERELAALRRWLASLLPESPARDDVYSVATELSSNAIKHTASGHGGWFAVEVTWSGPVVRVAVADSGAATEPRVIEDPDSEHGRGLLVVRELSMHMGVCGDDRGRLTWADVRWVASPVPAVAAPDGYEGAIRDGQAALARRFAGVPAWFGRATLAWWAVAGPAGLVSAPTAHELAGVLYRLLDTAEPAQGPDTEQARAIEWRADKARWQLGTGGGREPYWRRPGITSTGPNGSTQGHPARIRRPPMTVAALVTAGAA